MYIPTPSPEAIEYANTLSRLLGWSYVFCWGVSFYPQPIANYRRKAVTGLALDYFTVNVLGFTCYTISSALFLFSSTVRAQYARRHPLSPEPTVRWNDLAFAVSPCCERRGREGRKRIRKSADIHIQGHATLISIVTLSQFWFWRYKRDASQRLSSTMVAIIAACIAAVAIAILRVRVPAATGWQWEWIDVVCLPLLPSSSSVRATNPRPGVYTPVCQARHLVCQVCPAGMAQLPAQSNNRLVNREHPVGLRRRLPLPRTACA